MTQEKCFDLKGVLVSIFPYKSRKHNLSSPTENCTLLVEKSGQGLLSDEFQVFQGWQLTIPHKASLQTGTG